MYIGVEHYGKSEFKSAQLPIAYRYNVLVAQDPTFFAPSRAICNCAILSMASAGLSSSNHYKNALL
jgi:hypothetical protein